ncbi:MAG: metallophosphoesterase [Planctomycetota bacterium]
MSIFGTILTTIISLFHFYVFLSLSALPIRKKMIPLKIWISIAAGTWLLFFLCRTLSFDGGFGAALDFFAHQWGASVFLLACCLFVADISAAIGYLVKKTTLPAVRSVAAIAGLVLIIFAHIQGFRSPVVTQYDVTIDSLDKSLDGTVIVAITDLHVGEPSIGAGWLTNSVEIVQSQNPDMIVLVGDIFERNCAGRTDLTPALKRLSAPLGVWVVRGNHDTVRPDRRDVTGDLLASAGIRLLSNETEAVASGLLIAGIDDLTSSRRQPGEGEANVEKALSNLPAGTTTVYLSHTPWMAEEAAKKGVRLMLSGHTHNGQIWPFNYLVKTRYPLIYGRYDIDGMTLIVSRGSGGWGPRMRLWSPGEIVRITLRRPTD